MIAGWAKPAGEAKRAAWESLRQSPVVNAKLGTDVSSAAFSQNTIDGQVGNLPHG